MQQYSERWLLFFFLLFSVVLMKADRSEAVQTLRGRILDRITPVTSHPLQILKAFQSDSEIHSLKKEMAALEMDFALCREIQYENVRLRALLDLRSRAEYTLLPAEITGRGTRGLPGSVHLNVGSDKGCRRNLALIADGGACGRLVAVGRSSSVGQLLNDPASRISAMVQRSRVRGIVHWLYGDVFLLKGVPFHSNVTVGDSVVTSGFSDIYPKGLPIGTIRDIQPDESGLFLDIRLQPAVDFVKLEMVFVVMEKKKQNGE